MSDRFGRRWGISIGCMVFTVGLIIQVASERSWVQMAVGRFVVGVSVGWLSAAVPLYQSETVPRQVRGALVGTYQLFITLGILLSYVACYSTRDRNDTGQWRIPIAVGFAYGIILGVGILLCPESPRWLAHRNCFDEMKHVLAVMRGTDENNPYIMSEYSEIKAEVLAEKQMKQKGYLDCFRFENKTLYRTLLGILLQSGQQLTGANYFFYYGNTIFKNVGGIDSYIAQIILGAVNTGTTFPGLWALDHFGRRNCLLVGAAWMTIWLIVFATAGITNSSQYTTPDGSIDTEIDTYGISILMIVSACMFILAFASTWGPGVWSAIAEFSAPETRAKQFAMATMANWTWNFCIGFFTPKITDAISFNYGYVFMGCCIFNFLVVFFFVYETANLSLESINDMYLDPHVNAITSAKWIPPGYETRTGAQRDPVQAVKQVGGGVGGIPGDENIKEHVPNGDNGYALEGTP